MSSEVVKSCTSYEYSLLIISSEASHDLCPLSICSVYLPHSLHLSSFIWKSREAYSPHVNNKTLEMQDTADSVPDSIQDSITAKILKASIFLC